MKLAQTLSPENSKQILYMNKHSGKNLVVYENDELIWLTCDDVLQSAIYKEVPYRSVLPHSYVMLLPLLYDEEPKTILELGAGALSTQRYLRTSHPDVEMLSIEYDQHMIDISRDYFPAFEQLEVLHADAFEYVDKLQGSGEKFDWLMVDLFYGADSPMHKTPKAFLAKLTTLVAAKGWLIINILTKDKKELTELAETLKEVTAGKVHLFSVPEMLNHVFLVKLDQSFTFPEEITKHNLA